MLKNITERPQNTHKYSGIIVMKIYDIGIILPSASLLPPICLLCGSLLTLYMLCVETLRHICTNKRNIGEAWEKYRRQERIEGE